MGDAQPDDLIVLSAVPSKPGHNEGAVIPEHIVIEGQRSGGDAHIELTKINEHLLKRGGAVAGAVLYKPVDILRCDVVIVLDDCAEKHRLTVAADRHPQAAEVIAGGA